jgi:hypothetical protein
MVESAGGGASPRTDGAAYKLRTKRNNVVAVRTNEPPRKVVMRSVRIIGELPDFRGWFLTGTSTTDTNR